MPPQVSAVVLNFNGEQNLVDCLPSLVQQSYRPFEVIVVDNGSTDRSSEVVQSRGARWEPLGKNHGFARGNNLGAERANGEVIVFLNNDMRFDPLFIEELVTPLLEDPKVFSTDARQLNWEGDREIHLAPRLARRNAGTARTGGLLPRWELEQVATSSPADVFQACAANMAVRGSMFRELGGFDERLPIAWEDTEICWRAWLRGWRTLYVPTAFCWHRVGADSAPAAISSIRYRGTLGGRLLFATKHLPVEEALLTWLHAFAGGINEARRGQLPLFRRRLSVLREFGGYVPKLLAERKSLYRGAGTTPREHLRRLAALDPLSAPGPALEEAAVLRR
jgi:GT2 family glycosyltransferase